jgi:MFS family permease
LSTAATKPRVGIESSYNPDRLFFLSCMSLVAAAWVFAMRASIMADLGSTFGLTSGEVGASVGAAFLAFGISCFIGSPLCDFLGMGRLLGLACVLHIVGVVSLVFAPALTGAIPAVQLIWGSQFIAGLAHGLIEAVINPLAATIYPDNKTHKLNVLHAWWPGGIAIGGVLAYLCTLVNLNWQVRFGLVLIPVVIYGAMLVGQKFPPTERVASNVSNAEMFREIFKPAFLVLVGCMLLTASMELGPGQWVDAVLSKTVGFPGILVLVYVSLLMFGFRFFAGALAHKFSPIGLMWISSILAGLGLLALSYANNPVLGLLAATVWGMGVCYMWPTMLGITSERFPKGGALAMGMIGAAGSIIINVGLGVIGGIYDHFTLKHLPAGTDLKTFSAQAASNPALQTQLEAAKTAAAPYAFRYIGLLAIVLVVVFGIWWLIDKQRGGYKAIKLTQADPGDFSAEAVLETDVAAVRNA